jgi:hypothetical protein
MDTLHELYYDEAPKAGATSFAQQLQMNLASWRLVDAFFFAAVLVLSDWPVWPGSPEMDTDLDYGPEDVATAFEAYPRLTKESWNIFGSMFLFPPEWFLHVFTVVCLFNLFLP